MAKVKRVYEVAKELGVDSKAIVAKCAAEGVPGITGHMSPVKVGLVVTIHEWFSTSQHNVTAVETAAPVDLTKARKSRRRKAKAATGEQEHVDSGDAVATSTIERVPDAQAAQATAASEEQVEMPPVAVQAQVPAVAVEQDTPSASVDTAAPQAPPVAPPVEGSPVAPTPPADGTDTMLRPAARTTTPRPVTGRSAKAAKLRTAVQPAGVPNVPQRPNVVAPAGPRLTKPQQVQLKGPQVVRIEQPDVIRAPRTRRPGGPGGGGPAAGGGDNLPGILRSRGPARGRGAGGPVEEEAEGKPAAKRRTLSTRRGRSATADLPAGPTKFTEADLVELDARLNRAQGYVKLRRRELRKHEGQQVAQSAAVTGGQVEISEPITIKSLSSATGIKATDIIKHIFQKGVMATINSSITNEMATEVAMEYNIELVVRAQQTLVEQLVGEFENRPLIDERRRPPVVTVMGHVDHGKTSLLDRIRASDVATHEAGGITQHIGAYRVTIKGSDVSDKTVVFLDTPGHEAFTSLRARGASVTDLVVLVVAADDGVMPQTVESINHARAAGVSLLVALNKIDKPEATENNIRKIYGQLAEHGLNPVEWGGQTEVIKTSAEKNTGVKELLEILDLQADLLDLKADYGGPARATVIEAMMSPGRGPVARALVQQGTVNVGDFIVCGRAFGRVRDIIDDRGGSVRSAGPATPVEIAGLDMLPDAGDKLYVTDSLQKAEQIALQFREIERQAQFANQTKITLENFAQAMEAGAAKELRVVLKADVQGSVDVLRKSLEKLGDKEVGVKVLHAAVGGVTESDVLLAEASDAVIIGFNVVAPVMVRDLAEQRQVEIRSYRVIYDITDEIKKALEGMLEPETREEVLGTAEVREVFRITKVGAVAGCLVTDGLIQRAARMRVARQDIVVTDNRQIESLRRVKDDVREVRAGMECGIRLAGFDDIKPGDKLIAYQSVTVKRKLGS